MERDNRRKGTSPNAGEGPVLTQLCPFYQLPSVETNHYDVFNSDVFAEICDGQMLELIRNYRAENDVDFAEFITDLRIIKNGGKPDFKTYSNIECRKSLCWTNKTKKSY